MIGGVHSPVRAMRGLSRWVLVLAMGALVVAILLAVMLPILELNRIVR